MCTPSPECEAFCQCHFLWGIFIVFVTITAFVSKSWPSSSCSGRTARVHQTTAVLAFCGPLTLKLNFTSNATLCISVFYLCLIHRFPLSIIHVYKSHVGSSLEDREAQPCAFARCAWTEWQRHGGQSLTDLGRSRLTGHGNGAHLCSEVYALLNCSSYRRVTKIWALLLGNSCHLNCGNWYLHILELCKVCLLQRSF